MEIQNTSIRKIFVAIIFVITSTSRANDNIVIRAARFEDLKEILALDRRVTYEFFKPLFVSIYEHLGINQDAVHDLEIELADGEASFPEYTKPESQTKLYAAFDSSDNSPYGLIVFHQHDDITIEIDLLEVDANYRNKGVGRKLISSALHAFAGIKKCIVYPIQYNNESTLSFYQSLGFKNLGKGPADKKNSHGISYADMYFFYELIIE